MRRRLTSGPSQSFRRSHGIVSCRKAIVSVASPPFRLVWCRGQRCNLFQMHRLYFDIGTLDLARVLMPSHELSSHTRVYRAAGVAAATPQLQCRRASHSKHTRPLMRVFVRVHQLTAEGAIAFLPFGAWPTGVLARIAGKTLIRYPSQELTLVDPVSRSAFLSPWISNVPNGFTSASPCSLEFYSYNPPTLSTSRYSDGA